MPVTAEESTSAPLPASAIPIASAAPQRIQRRKEELQIELLKVQAGSRKAGAHRDAVRGPRRRRQAAPSSASPSTSTRAARGGGAGKPSERERGQWYFSATSSTCRPMRGEIVLFDRSWYNRAGVERVMGFCTRRNTSSSCARRRSSDACWCAAASGSKFWFSVSREEQLRRFNSRRNDPLKHWKLSPIDVQSLGKWDDYRCQSDVLPTPPIRRGW